MRTLILNIGLETGANYGAKEALTLDQAVHAVTYYCNRHWHSEGIIEASKEKPNQDLVYFGSM